MNRRSFITNWLAACGAAIATLLGRKPAAKRIPGTKTISVLDFHDMNDHSRVLSMTVFHDDMFVATERGVYRIRTEDGESFVTTRVRAT